jgi:hypothetical protein
VREFPAKGAYVLAHDSQGLWAGTPWGLWRYHAKERLWIQFVHPQELNAGDFQVVALLADSQNLWYGAMGLGLGYFNKQRVKWQSLRAGLSKQNVAAVAHTDSSVFTAYGYQGGYLDQFDPHTMQYERNLSEYCGVRDPNIQALAANGSVLYYGGFEGFGYLDLATGKTRYFPKGSPLRAYDITRIICEPSSCILGTVFGVAGFYPSADSFSMYSSTVPDRVTCMYVSGDSLWYGTLTRGVKLISRSKDSVLATFLTNAYRIVGIAPVQCGDGRTALFAATDQRGCYLIDPARGEATKCAIAPHLTGENPKSPEMTLRAMASVDSLVWLGTQGSGCLVFDPRRGRWGAFTRDDGLLSDQVRCLYDDGRWIWIGCYGGLHKVDKTYPKLMEIIFGEEPAVPAPARHASLYKSGAGG